MFSVRLLRPSSPYPVKTGTAGSLSTHSSNPINSDSGRFWAQPLWLWPNLLSLDAPVVAVLWLYLFAASAHVSIAPEVSLALGLVVWLIYVADRLFDGMRTSEPRFLSMRHRFYQSHRQVWLPAFVVVFCLAGWICLQLDLRLLICGGMMMLLVGAYFIAVHSLHQRLGARFPKELIVATVFGLGTFLPIGSLGQKSFAAMGIPLLLFVVLCWLNVVLIEYVEWLGLRDGQWGDPHPSTIMGGRNLAFAACLASLLALWALTSNNQEMQRPMLFAIAISALGLAVLASYRHRLSTNAVRVLADAALLSPALVLLFVRY